MKLAPTMFSKTQCHLPRQQKDRQNGRPFFSSSIERTLSRGKLLRVETRIEMKLRSLRFADDNEFRPTAADCLLTGDELEDRLDTCPIYTISSLERQLERVMQACGADARARVGAADAQPQARRQRT